MPTHCSPGQTLPEMTVPVTATLVAGGAIATRDWSLVHHDTAAAKNAGTPDIFMNILTTNGLIGRFVTDWAGPQAELTDVSIRLGAPNFPGDAFTVTGTVSEFDEDSASALIEVTGKNGIGTHASGHVRVALQGRKRS
ncbi:MaoC family dehydratase [Brevibacterium antiquum]